MSGLPERIPSITMDRAVGQYYESVDIDFVALQEYYDSIENEAKPPLEDCTIHFSSMAYVQGEDRVFGGIAFKEGQVQPTRWGESVPSTNIIVFLGSTFTPLAVARQDVSASPSEVVAHELVHYTQEHQPDPTMDKAEQKALATVAITSGAFKRSGRIAKFAAATGLAYIGASKLFHQQTYLLPRAAVAGAVVEGAYEWYTKPRRQRMYKEAYNAQLDLYHSKEAEKEAYAHEVHDSPFVLVEPKAESDRPKVLKIDELVVRANRAARKQHHKAVYGKALK